MEFKIGDGPIENRYSTFMRAIHSVIEEALNGKYGEQKVGFMLMVFPFGEGGHCNYTSNATPESIRGLLRDQLEAWEEMEITNERDN